MMTIFIIGLCNKTNPSSNLCNKIPKGKIDGTESESAQSKSREKYI